MVTRTRFPYLFRTCFDFMWGVIMKTYWITYYDGIGHAHYYEDKLAAMAEFIRLYFSGKTCGLMLFETHDGVIWNLRPYGINNPNPTPELPF